MNSDFQFALGETVYHRSMLTARFPAKSVPLFIVERIIQQCPGGVQRHYRCRILDSTWGFVEFNEIELIAAKEIPNSKELVGSWLNIAKLAAFDLNDFKLASAIRAIQDGMRLVSAESNPEQVDVK